MSTSIRFTYFTQVTGLGLYREGIDPERRSVSCHIQNIAIYCPVHFSPKYSVAKKKAQEVSGQMTSLLECQSREEYFHLCEPLIGKTSLVY